MAGKQGFSRDVFVGSLPDNVDDESIRALFSTIGDVQTVTMKEGKNNMSNFCFVRYFNEDHSDTAIAKLNGHVLNGRALSVKPASKKGQKPEGGGVGGGVMSRQPDNRAFQGQRQPRPQGGSYGPWGDAGVDREDIRQWKEESVAVTHTVDATTFYAQICNPETATAYQGMITQLFEHCSNYPPIATDIQPNQVYGAIFSADSGWYRCTVKGTDQATGKMSVLFVDYGNEEKVDNVVVLPEPLANIPFFAVKMSLWGLESCFPNRSSENAQKAVEVLSTLSEAENVSVRVSSQQPSPHECSVVLFLDGQNVNEMLFNNFADKRPSPAISPSQQQDGGGGGGGQHFQGGPRPGGHQQRGWTGSPPIAPGPPDNSTAALVGQLQNEKANLMQKVHELKIELQVTRSSKEIEVSGYREKLDHAVDYKVATALGSLRRVKKARSLYPSGENKKAPLEDAIDILQGGQITLNGETKSFRDATPRVSRVEDTLEHLIQCQDLIRNCAAKDGLEPLILDRNQARLDAYQAMKDFLDISDQLPINGRLADLQNMLNQITTSYPSMVHPLNHPEGPAEEIYEQYRAWLDLKTKKLKSYWKETETALSTWEGLASSMHQSFSLSGDSDFEAQNLDNSIQHLLVAMETELVISCQGYEPHITLNPEALKQRETELQLENEVLKNTVQTVLRDTGEEATRLRQLATHCMRYKGLMVDLENWLEATPNIDTLQALQKKIKVVRSKLRHLLVDLRDGEEDPDLLGDKTIGELKGDIANYQQQLLDQYTKEDELLSSLSQVTKEHFPELSTLHANLGLQKYIDSDGLIREGRDLMHFNLSAFPSCAKVTTKLASIGDKGVAVIKSQHLPDVASQRSYLERVLLYKTIGSPLLLPVAGIIPDPDSSQYHLQLPYHALGSLTQLMTSDLPLTPAQTLARLKDILLALQTLHSVQFFHGAVHPNNVLFQSRDEVYLADYDFSKLPIGQCKPAYNSSNGLCFQAPEVQRGMAACTASDIYSFGILVLWAHYPTSPFTAQANGVPDLEGLPIPRDLLNFVAPMLHPNPTNRPNVKHILDFGYLDRLAGVQEEEVATMMPDQSQEGEEEEVPGGDEGVTEVDPSLEIPAEQCLVEGCLDGETAGGVTTVTVEGGDAQSTQETQEEKEQREPEENEREELEGDPAMMNDQQELSEDRLETPVVEGQRTEEAEQTLVVAAGEQQQEQPTELEPARTDGSDVDSPVKGVVSLTNGSVDLEETHEEEIQEVSSSTPPPLLDD